MIFLKFEACNDNDQSKLKQRTRSLRNYDALRAISFKTREKAQVMERGGGGKHQKT